MNTTRRPYERNGTRIDAYAYVHNFSNMYGQDKNGYVICKAAFSRHLERARDPFSYVADVRGFVRQCHDLTKLATALRGPQSGRYMRLVCFRPLFFCLFTMSFQEPGWRPVLASWTFLLIGASAKSLNPRQSSFQWSEVSQIEARRVTKPLTFYASVDPLDGPELGALL